MTIPSCNKVLIHSINLKYNYRLVSGLVKEKTEVMALVKGDGYGHGLEYSARAFGEAGCRNFGVAELSEGVQLRNSGCPGEILVLLGCESQYLDYLFSHDLTPAVFSKEDLSAISVLAAQKKQSVDVYLKFDCGMSRLGFKPHDAQELISFVDDLQYINLRGIMSHYPCSDNRDSDNSETVFALFSQIVESIGRENIAVRSLCNSGGALYLPDSHGELIRAGISLYGYYPDGERGRVAWNGERLKPAMSYTSRVLQINVIPAGSGISYGHTYLAERGMKLAVIPVGYSNGYPRSVSNRAEVLIRGNRAPIRGRICMNLCMADVSEVEGVAAGDEVVLLGSQGSETISADEIAGWADTISYEILCSLGHNNQRVYE